MKFGIFGLLVLMFAAVVLADKPDPDDKRNFTQMIESRGYPCETHKVTTEDGYILTLFRIPYGVNASGNSRSSGKPPVFLQHGLLDSSVTWIINEQYESLAYILADLGFDVWMGNNRGNMYSIDSVNLNPKSKEFWEFSWDQMAQYDFPNMVDYVLSATGAKTLGYIGHSEGSLQVFAGLSERPEFAQKLNSFVALGPIVYVGHITNLFLRTLADLDVEEIFLLLGEKQFLPNSALLDKLFPSVCRTVPGLCDSVIEFICGPHRGAFNNSRMQVVAAHEPGGTSVVNVAHFAQNIKKKNFVMYDWGSKKKNEEHYGHGQHEPPAYNFSNFPSQNLPVALYYGNRDELADPTDVAWIIGHLPTSPQIAVELDDYAHLDYTWDYTAYAYFYPQLTNFLKTYAVQAF
eukprot:TRINITY_DN9222_c0_g1_i1.p1 TRINITY_DN9222_c0_g1~~TRINITY_DN9222_c0_g1_i1.p1  ORF type:complete len:404 (-),score=127.47 TRINITY_DN9222_c0_g1_i1:73-1284(-)